MINVSELITDPDFSQDFIIHRKLGSWVEGRFAETTTTITTIGVVAPASAKEIMQFPEGDRSSSMMVFFSNDEIMVTHNSNEPGTSDEIEWNDHLYRILSSNEYKDYGFYQAYGVYMEGS
jgi:hypothetical protein